MIILRMKVTPPAGQEYLGISFYSCPDVKNNPQKTLAFVQQQAVRKGVRFTYELATDADYYAQRGARAWLMTDPSSELDNLRFEAELVRAGLYENGAEIIGFITVNKDVVQVITEKTCRTIDTKAGTMRVQDHVQSAAIDDLFDRSGWPPAA